MLIITLSSIPPRFPELGATLQCLLRQSAKADRILLHIPYRYRRFPEWDGVLPEVPDGVEIVRVEEDLGPATKILPAAKVFRDTDCDLLFCDDDRAYPPGWAARFLRNRRRHPDAVIAFRGMQVSTLVENDGPRVFRPRAIRRWRVTDLRFQAKYLWRQIRAGRNWRDVPEPNRLVYMTSGYIDLFEGCAGVLAKPAFFDDSFAEIPPVLWSVDDIWLSGMLTRKGVPIWLDCRVPTPPNTTAQAFDPLAGSVINGADRHAANQAAIRYMQKTYGIWP